MVEEEADSGGISPKFPFSLSLSLPTRPRPRPQSSYTTTTPTRSQSSYTVSALSTSTRLTRSLRSADCSLSGLSHTTLLYLFLHGLRFSLSPVISLSLPRICLSGFFSQVSSLPRIYLSDQVSFPRMSLVKIGLFSLALPEIFLSLKTGEACYREGFPRVGLSEAEFLRPMPLSLYIHNFIKYLTT